MGTHPIFESDFDCLTVCFFQNMPDIVDFFSGYGSYHHNKVNMWIHVLCVPLILICVNGHGEFMKVNDINWVLLVNTCAILFYISMDAFSGLICACWMYSAHFFWMSGFIASNATSANMTIGAVHAFSWIAQFVGHGVFEGHKPALMDNLLQGLNSQKLGIFSSKLVQ